MALCKEFWPPYKYDGERDLCTASLPVNVLNISCFDSMNYWQKNCFYILFHTFYYAQRHLLATLVTIFKIPTPNFYSFRSKYTICLILPLYFVSEIFTFVISMSLAGHMYFSCSKVWWWRTYSKNPVLPWIWF